MINVGDKIQIDRWGNADPQIYEVKRICKSHINVKSKSESWAMPNKRIKDILVIYEKE